MHDSAHPVSLDQPARTPPLAAVLRKHGATLPQYAVLTTLDEEPSLSNARTNSIHSPATHLAWSRPNVTRPRFK